MKWNDILAIPKRNNMAQAYSTVVVLVSIVKVSCDIISPEWPSILVSEWLYCVFCHKYFLWRVILQCTQFVIHIWRTWKLIEPAHFDTFPHLSESFQVWWLMAGLAPRWQENQFQITAPNLLPPPTTQHRPSSLFTRLISKSTDDLFLDVAFQLFLQSPTLPLI